MKRFLCMGLLLVLLVSLMACGEPKVEVPSWKGQFAVGFGRADVTPTFPTEMKGYGAAGSGPRTSEGALNYLYITCLAFTDEADNTVLLYTYDHKSFKAADVDKLRTAVSEATGIAMENIIISATHTHSAPELGDNRYLQIATQGAVKAATDALADREAATWEYTSATLENMTFVRHYVTSTGVVVGDNFHPEGAGQRVSHTTEADKEMRLIRILREGKKPILMVNWLGHNSLASTGRTEYGKANRNLLSSDFVGFCRTYVESNYDCLFAMYMGAGGNVNPTGLLLNEPGQTTAIAYGEQLGKHILTAVQTMSAGQTGGIRHAISQFQGVKSTFDIHAFGMGSLGVITAPVEMFDTTSMAIREDSPYEITFVLTIANGHYGYLPTEICYDYDGCYEVGGGFARGDAERIVGDYLELLKQTKE